MRAILFTILCLSASASAGADDQFNSAQKREWLIDRIAAASRAPDAEMAAKERVARLSESQLDALFDYYRSGKADADQRRAEALDQEHDLERLKRAAAARAYQQRLAAGPARPGYAPVITTLPSGAALGASAVVSPDRRYVRINAMPFFSSVQGFYTFNMANGHTQYYPIPQDPYGYGTQPYYYPGPYYSPALPPYQTLPTQPALQGVVPRPALEGYVPRPALQPR